MSGANPRRLPFELYANDPVPIPVQKASSGDAKEPLPENLRRMLQEMIEEAERMMLPPFSDDKSE